MRGIILTILFMLLPAVCHAETATAQDAVRALRSLNILSATGTSYKDFAYCFGEVKSEVDSFLKSETAKQNTKLRDAVSETLALYELADQLFQRTDEARGLMKMGAGASKTEKKIAAEYFSRFPEDKKESKKGGVLTQQKHGKFQLRAALSRVFGRASQKYAEAQAMLN